MSYPKFIDFGRGLNKQIVEPTNSANPLTYCTFPTLNAQFVHGSTSANLLYTPYSPNCQSFMTDYCSESFDGFCEAYSVINVDRTWPNNAGVDTVAQKYANSFQGFHPTVGENMIRNVVHRRFIFFPSSVISYQQFDPNTANSPIISYQDPYVTETSAVVHLGDPASIEKDPKVALMLSNARACFDVLARIYLAVMRKEANVNIEGTGLEQFFLKNSELFLKFLQHAVRAIPSFQLNRIDPRCKHC